MALKGILFKRFFNRRRDVVFVATRWVSVTWQREFTKVPSTDEGGKRLRFLGYWDLVST